MEYFIYFVYSLIVSCFIVTLLADPSGVGFKTRILGAILVTGLFFATASWFVVQTYHWIPTNSDVTDQQTVIVEANEALAEWQTWQEQFDQINLDNKAQAMVDRNVNMWLERRHQAENQIRILTEQQERNQKHRETIENSIFGIFL